jgi:hypothetical protein
MLVVQHHGNIDLWFKSKYDSLCVFKCWSFYKYYLCRQHTFQEQHAFTLSVLYGVSIISAKNFSPFFILEQDVDSDTSIIGDVGQFRSHK